MKNKIENFKNIKDALNSIDNNNKNEKYVDYDEKEIIEENESFNKTKKTLQKSAKENETYNDHNGIDEIFYLEKEVRKIMKDNENKRKIEIEKVNKECEKIEAKDRKYMETLKAEFLAKYQEEQDRCQQRLDLKKKKELEKIEKKMKEENERIERMCEKEVIDSINKIANDTSWFEVAIKIYKACPDLFEK